MTGPAAIRSRSGCNFQQQFETIATPNSGLFMATLAGMINNSRTSDAMRNADAWTVLGYWLAGIPPAHAFAALNALTRREAE